jgi:ParB family chromosome partitioning protein
MAAAAFSCRTIASASIDFTTEWSLHPWASAAISDELSDSFGRTGILHKPIVLAKAGGRFDIISGFRRLCFLVSSTKAERIDCLVLARTSKPAAILDILLTDQGLFQPLSLAEKAQFIQICSLFFDQKEIVAIYLERLHLPKRSSIINDLTVILGQDPLMITEIHAGRLQEKMVSELLRLPEQADQIAMIRLFKELAMGDGKQKKFFTLIRDISFRQGSSVAAYLKTPAIQEIVNNQGLNTPQKIFHLGNLLQQQIHPSFSQAEGDFVKRVGSLHLPACCTLSHSPSFETDEVTLSISFKNFSDCHVRIQELKKILL